MAIKNAPYIIDIRSILRAAIFSVFRSLEEEKRRKEEVSRLIGGVKPTDDANVLLQRAYPLWDTTLAR